MKPAQSFPVYPPIIRPENHRVRHEKPVRKRIRSSVSAGPTGKALCRPCSASADVSSISSSTTDSTEERDTGKDITAVARIMHAKHSVVRCVREQMIKLVNNDLVPVTVAQDDLVTKLNRSPIKYGLNRRRSLCEKICEEDDTLHPRLMLRDKHKYGFDNTDPNPSETQADDGRVLGGKSRFKENSPCQFDGRRYSPDRMHYSSMSRQLTRKSNKFFVPFTNNNNNNDMDEEPFPKNTPAFTEKLSPEKDVKQLTRTSANPSVKTFYENPHLKEPCASLMMRKSDETLLCRSTNTSPIPRKTQSTNTIATQDITSQKMCVAMGKDAANPGPTFYRPFHVMQPLLFVLAMFTVSMSGAYVGILVASAGCASWSGVECEQSILQWLFSSRRQIRAF